MSYYIIERTGKIFKKPVKGRKEKSTHTDIIKGMDKYGGGILLDFETGRFFFIPDKRNTRFVDRIRDLPIRSISKPVIRVNMGEMRAVNDINRILAGIIAQQRMMLNNGIGTLIPNIGAFGTSPATFGNINSSISPYGISGPTRPIVHTSSSSPAVPVRPRTSSNTTQRPSSSYSNITFDSDGQSIFSSDIPQPIALPPAPPAPPEPPAHPGQPARAAKAEQPAPPAPPQVSGTAHQQMLAEIVAKRQQSSTPPTLPTPLPSVGSTSTKLITPDPPSVGLTEPKKPIPVSGTSIMMEMMKSPAFIKHRDSVRGTPSPTSSSSSPPPLVPRRPHSIGSTEESRNQSVNALKTVLDKLYKGPLYDKANLRYTNVISKTPNRVGLTKFVKNLEETLSLCEGVSEQFDKNLYDTCNKDDNIAEIKSAIEQKRKDLNTEYSDLDDTCMPEEHKIKHLTDTDNTVKKIKRIVNLNNSNLSSNKLLEGELLAFIISTKLITYLYPRLSSESEDIYTERILKEYNKIGSENCITIIKFILLSLIIMINKRLTLIKSKSKIIDDDFKKKFGNLHKVSVDSLYKDLNELVMKLSKHYNIDILTDYNKILTKFEPNMEFFTKFYNMILYIHKYIGDLVINNVKKIETILNSKIYNIDFLKCANCVLNFEHKYQNNFDKISLNLMRSYNLINKYRGIAPVFINIITPNITSFTPATGDRAKFNTNLLKLRNALIEIKNPFLLIQYNLADETYKILLDIDNFYKSTQSFKYILGKSKNILERINNINKLPIIDVNVKSTISSNVSDMALVDKVNNQISEIATYKLNLEKNIKDLKNLT